MQALIKKMFTGIIKGIGEVTQIKQKKGCATISVSTQHILRDKEIGDSISVNGICVTITKMQKNGFEFDVMPETLERTSLKEIKIKDKLNLESPIKANQALDGHLVQGHVDAVGKVQTITKKGGKVQLTIEFPQQISKYLAFKGSITINGVSLTISDLRKNTFSVDLIPHTIKKTNLGELKKGNNINLEIDLIARYLERLLTSKDNEAKYEYLKERGII